MEEIASVYARSLFEVAQEQNKLDAVRDQLGEFADALDSNQEMQVFFFSPYFSTPEKVEGLDKVVTGAEPILKNFLDAADREEPHAGRVPRPARRSTSCGSARTSCSPSRSPRRSSSTRRP